ncbi:MAG: dihydroneopterin aldolase [Candidatus Peribacteraceae bacterium]|nr:dihydroneopterin aldolase [Candidatus Peribacteraceae bacterium]
MDSIQINNLEIQTQIGVPDKERENEQRIICSIEIFFDAKPTAISDNINEGIDYEKVINNIQKLATKERKTIERFAEDIASCVLNEKKAKEVSVRIEKFVIPNTKSVAVEIKRCK